MLMGRLEIIAWLVITVMANFHMPMKKQHFA